LKSKIEKLKEEIVRLNAIDAEMIKSIAILSEAVR
jgi:hypothetical protein